MRVLARVCEVPEQPDGWLRVDGSGVSVHALPYYIGPLGYVRSYRRLRRAVAEGLMPGAAIVLRAPGVIATLAASVLNKRGYPFALEVVGDPWDVFAPGAVDTPLRPFLRRWFAGQLRRSCATAAAVLYVTQGALQRRYPARGMSTFASNVELTDECFIAQVSHCNARDRMGLRIAFVGSLAQLYKGPDVLLKATADCVRRGADIEVAMIGDGRFRSQLERLSRALGVAGHVKFLGALPAGPAIRTELDKADVFVLPSRTEGMPRALIEAMARGLPCISTPVGGIPELLQPECLVPVGDARALADRLMALVRDKGQLQRLGRRNLDVARSFHDRLLQQRRSAFYASIAAQTEEWLRRNSGA